MIKVSVLYPSGDDATFDMDYYLAKHMPMVQETLGVACKSYSVDSGISGGAPGSTAAFVAAGHLFFDSVEEFNAAFGPNASSIMADVPNYTNIQPEMMISEVKA